eukprot:1148622-Pelagomonas_calceolata.AAC.4
MLNSQNLHWKGKKTNHVCCGLVSDGIALGRFCSKASKLLDQMQPFLLHEVSSQFVHQFLHRRNAKLFFFVSELMDLFLAGRDQPQADQPNDLAEGHPPL